jgi:hypothetical protein
MGTTQRATDVDKITFTVDPGASSGPALNNIIVIGCTSSNATGEGAYGVEAPAQLAAVLGPEACSAASTAHRVTFTSAANRFVTEASPSHSRQYFSSSRPDPGAWARQRNSRTPPRPNTTPGSGGG